MQDITNRDQGHYETMDSVIRLFITGDKNATAISKELGIPRKDVLNYIDEWKTIASSTEGIKDRATQALNEMDLHFDMIIKEQWAIVNDPTNDVRTRATVLKQISEVESKRQETLQKAGLYDDAGITDELVRMQEYTDKIKQLLLVVAKVFPDTKPYIKERLALLSNEIIVLDDDSVLKGEVVSD